MLALLRPAIVLFVIMTLITGLVYPAIVTAISYVAFRPQSQGNMVTIDAKEIGSQLIAQPFTDTKYFWPRPSAANYDATASAGSNLAPSNPALADAVKGRVDALRAADPGNTATIPVDLVTASASGLDPHISIAAARYQAARIARARGIVVDEVMKLIDHTAESPLLGVLDDAKVNVLELNLALDHPQQFARMVSRSETTGWKAHGFMPDSN